MIRSYSKFLLLASGLVGFLGSGCAPSDEVSRAADGRTAHILVDDTVPRAERMMSLVAVLAADSMEGRGAGTAGERRARDFLIRELERYGVEPAGEEGYLQAVPLGASGDRPPISGEDTGPADPERGRAGPATAWNVIGIIPGHDPVRAGEFVIVGAHYDHLGIGRPLNGDSIYNGADDDASGTAAVLEIARALARQSPRPDRSVLVALFSGEEMGLLGPRWFLAHPTVPVERIVANLQIEMIGRPDSLAGGPGRGWLTGFERSTMGDLLTRTGIPIVPDPRPEQRFFFRSDNLPFARAGIPAHTLSSFDLHPDYHTPKDEVDRIDARHMAELTEAALAMVRVLASGERPRWHAGGRPVGGSR